MTATGVQGSTPERIAPAAASGRSASADAVLGETPDLFGAYPRLSEAQLARLRAEGSARPTRPGDVLYREGEHSESFFVVLAGDVAVVDAYGAPDARVIGIHGPARFLGELGLIVGEVAFASAVMRTGGEVLEVAVQRIREVVSFEPSIGDLILRAYLIRRSILIDLGVGFRVVGSRFSPDTRRLREFAARNRLPHKWLDLEVDRSAARLLEQLAIDPSQTPVVIWGHSEVLRNPSNGELARMLGLPAPSLDDVTCDLLVVGAGPAGLAAAVYGASEGLRTVVLEAVASGGQAGTSSRIENYLGFPSGISGGNLAERAVLQAVKFGAELVIPGEACGYFGRGGEHVVRLVEGREVSGRAVLIATGVRYRRLAVPRLERFEGVSVFYAATELEAQACRGDPVVVVGGGNSAGQAALFLARTAHVCLVVRGDDLEERMSSYLAARIRRDDGVSVVLHCEVRELHGDSTLEAVVLEDTHSGDRRRVEARALFSFIGAEPHVDWLAGQVALDDRNFVITGAPEFLDGTTASPGAGRRAPPAPRRDQSSGRLRRRRRPQRLDQASGVCGGRGGDGGSVDPRAPRRHGLSPGEATKSCGAAEAPSISPNTSPLLRVAATQGAERVVPAPHSASLPRGRSGHRGTLRRTQAVGMVRHASRRSGLSAWAPPGGMAR